MPRLTTEQITSRRLSLGSSDLPAILGLSTTRGPADVWLEKTGVAGELAQSEDEASDWGHRLEPTIAQAYQDRIEQDSGVTVRLDPSAVSQVVEWRSATPDYYVWTEDRQTVWLLECKARAAWKAKDWGEDGTNQVPDDIRAQVQWQMLVTGICRCDVAVLFGTFDFRVYRIEEDAAYQNALLAEAEKFWALVQRQQAPDPDATPAYTRLIQALNPKPADKVVLEGDEAVESAMRALRRATDAAQVAQDEVDYQKNLLRTVIGPHYGVQTPAGKAIWYTSVTGRGVDWTGLAEHLMQGLDETAKAALLLQFQKPGKEIRSFKFTPSQEA